MTAVRVLEMFDRAVVPFSEFIAKLTDESELVASEAREFLQAIAPDLAYTDRAHPFQNALFFCAIHLSLYKAAEKRGVGVHQYGEAMLADLAARTGPAESDGEGDAAGISHFPERGDHPGEFDVEVVQPEPGDDSFKTGYNVKSCAICYLFGQHDAMELVPYMCASDDVVSDAQDQGLKRTGTIALGAHRCDFRYGGTDEPKRVADDYPERIKFVHA